MIRDFGSYWKYKNKKLFNEWLKEGLDLASYLPATTTLRGQHYNFMVVKSRIFEAKSS